MKYRTALLPCLYDVHDNRNYEESNNEVELYNH